MKKVVFFDLDNTLWDHKAAQKFAISKIYEDIREGCSMTMGVERFEELYNICNDKVWSQYRNGTLPMSALRVKRFSDLLEACGIRDEALANYMNESFINIYPQSPTLMKGAERALSELYGKYELGLVTNGFAAVQERKLESCGIRKYFKAFVYSELVGKSKPDPAIFDYALNQVNVEAADAIYIGDDLEVDMGGAKNAGLSTIWLRTSDKEGQLADQYADFTIMSLEELLDIL